MKQPVYVMNWVRHFLSFFSCPLGSQREELIDLLVPVAANTEGADITEVSLAALALGMAFVGTCNDEVIFVQTSFISVLCQCVCMMSSEWLTAFSFSVCCI
jgi:hypothetical protein